MHRFTDAWKVWRRKNTCSTSKRRSSERFEDGLEEGYRVDESERASFEMDEDTIVGLATGPCVGSISIVRVSGPDALRIGANVFRRKKHGTHGSKREDWIPKSHFAYYGSVFDAVGREVDEALLLAMHAPRSYTREHVVEIHGHGGGICSERILRCILQAGARMADPGEFTMRAWMNGRIDLAQAESVMKLVQARTPSAADAALAGLRGDASREMKRMKETCMRMLVDVEARVDFEEADGILPIDLDIMKSEAQELLRDVRNARETAERSIVLQRGATVALVGRPNAGKSSLLNAMAGCARAIVSDVPGTTRDVVEAESMSARGTPLRLLDTAGIRDSQDVVECIGVARAEEAARAADAVLLVMDGALGWGEEEERVARAIWGSSSCTEPQIDGSVGNELDLRSRNMQRGPLALLVINKADTMDEEIRRRSGVPVPWEGVFSGVVHTCAVDGTGVEELQEAMADLVSGPNSADGHGIVWAASQRQVEALYRAEEALDNLMQSMEMDMPEDCYTIDLKAAVMALGEATGDMVGEEVLTDVFSRFCIGK